MSKSMDKPTLPQPWCAMHEDKIIRLWAAVFGNGRPGLVSRMDRMESKMDTAVSLLQWQIGIMLVIGTPFIGWLISKIFA